MWAWAPLPTKDLALKRVVFDSTELLALYEGLQVSPEVDAERATEEWIRQGTRNTRILRTCLLTHLPMNH